MEVAAGRPTCHGNSLRPKRKRARYGYDSGHHDACRDVDTRLTLSARSAWSRCAGAEPLGWTQRPRSGIRAAIPLIVAGFLIEFVVIGGGVDTVSVFLNALATTNGWPRGMLSAGIGVGVVADADIDANVGHTC